mgnify:CR=1 FL=1
MSSTILPPSKRTEASSAFDTRFRGLGVPVIKRPGGYLQSLFSPELIRSSIIAILLTRKGERVFLPDFGSNLHKLVFEPNDAVLKNLLKQVVTQDVTRWEKRVRVRDIRISSADHTVKLYVEYEIVNTSIVDAATISFSQKTYTATAI